MKKTLKVVALLEAVSFLVLLAATVAKYTAEQPQAVKVVGPIHGMLFIAYVLLVLMGVERPLYSR